MILKCFYGGWCYRCYSFVCSSSWLFFGVLLVYLFEERKRDIDVGNDVLSKLVL